MAGKCKKHMCLFKHVRPQGWKKPICKLYHSWFKCKWGKDCVYVHGGEPPEGAVVEKPTGSKMPVFSVHGPKQSTSRKKGRGVSTKKGRGGAQAKGSFGAYGKVQVRRHPMRRICFNFQKGLCTQGSTCRYMHMHEGAVGRQQQELQSSNIMRAQPYSGTAQLPQTSTLNEEGLPAGWSSQYDHQHQIKYYYNLYTGKSQWEEPTSPALPITIPEKPAPVANIVKVGVQTQQGTTQKPMYVQAGQNALFARVITQHAVAQPSRAHVNQLQYRQ